MMAFIYMNSRALRKGKGLNDWYGDEFKASLNEILLNIEDMNLVEQDIQEDD